MFRQILAPIVRRFPVGPSTSHSPVTSSATLRWSSSLQRATQLRTYPTTIVMTDGSSISVRHPSPEKLIRMPVEMSQLSSNDQQERLARRKPQRVTVEQEAFDDSFDPLHYAEMAKKTKL